MGIADVDLGSFRRALGPRPYFCVTGPSAALRKSSVGLLLFGPQLGFGMHCAACWLRVGGDPVQGCYLLRHGHAVGTQLAGAQASHEPRPKAPGDRPDLTHHEGQACEAVRDLVEQVGYGDALCELPKYVRFASSAANAPRDSEVGVADLCHVDAAMAADSNETDVYQVSVKEADSNTLESEDVPTVDPAAAGGMLELEGGPHVAADRDHAVAGHLLNAVADCAAVAELVDYADLVESAIFPAH